MWWLFVIPFAIATIEDPTITFEELYQYGKNEYTAKNWPDCVGFMRRAVEDFNYYQDEVLWCREKCSETIAVGDGSRLSSIHSNAQRALCLYRCKRERLTEMRPQLRKQSVWFDMEERKPYQYMHICYWHQGDLPNAVKTAYTFLVRNPQDQETLDNLRFYMEQPGYDSDQLVDLLRKDYERLYIDGIGAYNNEDWDKCVTSLELSLEKVFREEKICRLDCQDKIDWSTVDGTHEMDIISASMYVSVLRCENGCLNRLSWVNGHTVGNVIASHFEYLHFCQYKMMRGIDASKSVANYLLFDDSPAMRRNKFAYLKQYGKPELFTPDPKLVDIRTHLILEERILKFIDTRMKLNDKKEFLPEQADDRNKLDVEVDVEDRFEYDLVERTISRSECKLLRSPFQSTVVKSLLKEISSRVSSLFSLQLKFDSVSCSSTTRHPICARSLVISLDEQDCSSWLSATHQGCAVVFCAS